MARGSDEGLELPAARSERGAAAVELAMVLPFLVMLFFGIVAFGIVFAQQLALGNAARQGARYGVVADRTCAQIVTEARAAADTIRMRGADTTVSVRMGASEATAASTCTTGLEVPCEGSNVGDNLYVTVGYSSELVIPLVAVEPLDLQAKGVFRCEFS